MASNSFGNLFKMTTWGESHGKAIGVVIDGCPAGLEIEEEEIHHALALRAPGRRLYTSPRSEEDKAQILSGVFEGKTTGAPISILIPNRDADSSKYEPIKDLLRPGHANYTYLEKYGIFDYRGGGRASARETACRVAAGTIAKKLLRTQGIQTLAYIKQIGHLQAKPEWDQIEEMRVKIEKNSLFCPDPLLAPEMEHLIEEAMQQKDSIGGIVEFVAWNVPVGLGDPIYQKLEANLAYAMMSLPATKGFEIGSGFESVSMRGSVHNDRFKNDKGSIRTDTNYAGGALGGISNGMPLVGRVAFKPASSIMQRQNTLTTEGKEASFQLPEGSRHDPCVAIRAVPVVEAMLALVLADAMLLNRCAKL
ncbi:chorismate synthase [Parachlamydia sp. AcF125]|uniref:chorismate synthase n=1 Tax=Parachlamydia sp. AcF125 TaxID=2795736 RepID=UPI001BCA28C5|nr:chorismate synthase [Parachlamydia sp. AcF125]MBS4168957.1 Chorismate synthase [Parachlamydia sp. AcF125]